MPRSAPQPALSLPLRAVGRSRPRRTQAERSEETREKIIAAATACIAQQGLRNATTQAIALHAGVTWGAMQHQFGDKDAVIDAVIARSMQEFVGLMQGLRQAEPNLGRRVHAFTRRWWAALKGPYYRAVLEILLRHPEKTRPVAAASERLWIETFGDLALSKEQLRKAHRFAFLMLGGIALESLVGPGMPPFQPAFRVLEKTLLEMFRSGRTPRVRKRGRLE
jgi:AcrR family transcriptional regulator